MYISTILMWKYQSSLKCLQATLECKIGDFIRTSKSVVMSTLLDPDRNSFIIISRSF
jgi:hypothetical protein